MQKITEYANQLVNIRPYNWTGMTAAQLIYAGRIAKRDAANRLLESVRRLNEDQIQSEFQGFNLFNNDLSVDIDAWVDFTNKLKVELLDITEKCPD